ncbi:MAG: hypothetical protein AAGM16_14175 [Pseudomonadota bacterium]
MKSLSEIRSAKRTFVDRIFSRSIEAYRTSTYLERTASIESTKDTPLNVVGVFVGLKRTADGDVPERCLRVLVRKKLPKSQLSKRMIVPSRINGIETDIVEVGHLRSAQSACDNPTARIRRPFNCGVSVSGFDTGAGSLGYLFSRIADQSSVVLSNYHVLAPSGSASNAVYQPGLGDANHRPQDIFGSFVDGTPVRYCQGGQCPVNDMDAAIATVRPRMVAKALCRVGELPDQLADPRQGAGVWMFGRSSRGVQGSVLGVGGDALIRYGRRLALFRNVVEIEPVRRPRFGKPGDSGSVVIDMNRRICALLFATDGRRNGYATPIRPIMRRFGLTAN